MKTTNILALVLTSVLFAAAQPPPNAPLGAGDNKPEMKQAMGAMSHDKMEMGDHMGKGDFDMGPHMKMTALRPAKPGDADRAKALVEAARATMEKYKDYHAALNDGYKIFMPNLPLQHKHFTNYLYAMENQFAFNPAHPTSLLYDVDGSGYKLTGLMFTAPKNMTEDELDQRVPLSVAQWHEHVNLCQPPADQRAEQLGKHSRFGLGGSISNQKECEAAGGKFMPIIFNWMVHMYPNESSPDKVWSMEKQHSNMSHME